MPKARKPVLSLAAAIQRAHGPLVQTPAAAAASTTGSGTKATPAAAATAGASSSAANAAGTAGKKRKRAAQLISAFHVLQREQEALAARKAAGTVTGAAYAREHAALEARLAELGGLESYQSLSIAGHSNSKYRAFNTSHWVLRVLASEPPYANLKPLAKRGAPSGTEEQPTGAGESAAVGTDGAPLSNAEARKLARRQKEREKKRARKRQRKAEEEQAAAPKGKLAASSSAAAANNGDEDDADALEALPEDDDDEHDEEEQVEGGDGGASSGSATAAPSAPLFSSLNRVKLLDVGAITNHYLPYASLVDCTAIDLNPQHPSVLRRDFFDMDSRSPEHYRHFDVVVLSLVLNFVGDRFARGEMIKRSVHMLRSDGVGRLFIILPSACLKNSRWMDHDSFVQRCMRPLGLKLGQWHYTNKLACYEFVREEVTKEQDEEEEAALAEAAAAKEAAATAAAADDAPDGDAEEGDAAASDAGVKKPAVAAPPAVGALKKKKKGFQPAGIVLAGETRNNFSIAWRADY